MKHLLLILLVFNFSAGFSQDLIGNEPITTDRPDQTESPTLVPKGMFQMESGFSYEQANPSESAIMSPTLLWKYGINENFELRLITEYSINKIDGKSTSGLNPVLVGFKVRLAEEKGLLPKMSFIGHLVIPDLASKGYRADYYAPEFRFTMQHSLSEKISLSYNLGAEWDGFTPEATFIYTLATGFELTDKLGVYTEVYGFAPQQAIANHRFDAGFTYLLSNDTMVDLSGGFGLTENAPDYFAAVGFSFRL